MIELLIYNWKPITKIIIASIIYIFLFTGITAIYMKQYIKNNWLYFREKWYIIPISGFIIEPPKGVSKVKFIYQNAIAYVWTIVKKILNILVKPFYVVIKLLLSILNTFRGTIDTFRKQFKVMRNFLFKIVSSVFERLQNINISLTYFLLKIRELLKRQVALFKQVSWTSMHSYYFLRSLVSGPMGELGKWGEKAGLSLAYITLGPIGIGLYESGVCFDPATLIKLYDNSQKYISELKLNDVLIDGSIVMGTCHFGINKYKINMYNYNGVIVTGDHLVYEKGAFIRVNESSISIKVPYRKDMVICLITNSGKIPINNMEFCDFLDTHNQQVNLNVHKIVESSLNNHKTKTRKSRCTDLVWGFGNKNTISINNKHKIISDLKIGDYIGENRIRGKILLDKSIVSEYIYKSYNGDNIILSGNCLVYENNCWIRINQSNRAMLLTNTNEDYYINYITDTNQFEINKTRFRDFIETSDLLTNKIIDETVDEYLFNNQAK